MSDTQVWRAAPATAHASRYLQQLCKHWSHKFAVTFDPQAGTIDLGDGVVCSLTASPDHLDVELSAPAETAPRMREVVENHLRRFAHREPEIVFDWREAA